MRLLIFINCPDSQRSLLGKVVEPTGTFITNNGEYFILDSSIHGKELPEDLYAKKSSIIWNKARNFISEINGAASLSIPSWEPINLTNIKVVQPERETRWLPITVSVELRNSPQTLTATIQSSEGVKPKHNSETRPIHPAANLLLVAQEDESVAKLLRLQQYAMDWTNLYRIYEIIKDDYGKKEIISKKWAMDYEINAFTGSANNPNVSGDDSRHGIKKGERPRKTMGITKARILIAHITREWLNHKTREKAT